MEPDIAEIKENYARFSDEKLIRLATEDAASLRPEALEALKEILRDRCISEEIIRGIDAQLKDIDESSLEDYAEILRNLPCPMCNSSAEKLNATIVYKVKSFFLTYFEMEFKIACPKCLDELNRDAMFKSGLLGWWGLPWGIIRTVQSLIGNKKMIKQNRLPEANYLLMNFVFERVGRIEANRNNPEELQLMIKHIR